MNTIECFVSSGLPLTDQHTHVAATEIRYMQSGTMNIAIGGQIHTLREHDVVLIPTGTPHTVSSDGEFSAILIYAKDLAIDNPIIAHDYDKSILMLYRLLLKLMTEKEESYNVISDIITDAICKFILKCKHTEFRRKFTVEFKNLLYENIPNADFKVTDEIIKRGYNADYFRRCFKEDFGQTPHDYLINIRIDNVCKLLRNSEKARIENIAALCGFNDSYYLSKIFKQKIGLSPRDYRKKFKNI